MNRRDRRPTFFQPNPGHMSRSEATAAAERTYELTGRPMWVCYSDSRGYLPLPPDVAKREGLACVYRIGCRHESPPRAFGPRARPNRMRAALIFVARSLCYGALLLGAFCAAVVVLSGAKGL